MSVIQYDNIVSLGGSCKAAYEARAYFNFGEAYPFDWWISRADQIARYLRDADPDALYARENLKLKEGIGSVASATYDFIFQHEFPREWTVDGAPVSSCWADAIPEPRERHRALLARLFNLDHCQKRLLFIRTCEAKGDTAAIDDLLDAITSRFCKAYWHLLVINPMAPLADDPRILTANIPLEELKWTGYATEPWIGVFEKLSIRMAPGMKPFPRGMRAEIDV